MGSRWRTKARPAPAGGTADDDLATFLSDPERFFGVDREPGAAGGDDGEDSGPSAESVIGDTLSKLPPNPELVARLQAMPLEEFADFVRANVPTGALSIEEQEELDVVRLRGALFRAEELERVVLRLGYGWGRLQPEIGLDAWEVARGLRGALEEAGAEGVRVDAYVVARDPTLFVQFLAGGGVEAEQARDIAESFVVDRGLLWVRAYSASK